MNKMNGTNVDYNNIPIGQTISKCKDDIRSILYRLKDIYAPCDLDTARGFTQNLIQSLNKVFDDFIADIEKDSLLSCPNEASTSGAVNTKEIPNLITISDSDNESEMATKNENSTTNTETQSEKASQIVVDTSTPKNALNYCENSKRKIVANVLMDKSKKYKVMHTRNVVNNNKSFGEKRCEVCRKVFKTTQLLVYHRRIHLDAFPIHCRACLYTFSTDEERSIHANNCDTLRYECYICRRIARDRGTLVRHMRMHSAIKPIKCSFCNQTYRFMSSMTSHIAEYHIQKKKPFTM